MSILKKLLRIDVYEVGNLKIRWSIKRPSKTPIEGRSEDGRVSVYEMETHMEIWITRAENSGMGLPIDAIDELVTLWGDLDAETTGILHYILMENDLGRIEDYLERRGIMGDPNENWTTDGTQYRAILVSVLI